MRTYYDYHPPVSPDSTKLHKAVGSLATNRHTMEYRSPAGTLLDADDLHTLALCGIMAVELAEEKFQSELAARRFAPSPTATVHEIPVTIPPANEIGTHRLAG